LITAEATTDRGTDPYTQSQTGPGTARTGRLVRLFGYGEFRVVLRAPPEEFNVNNIAELAALD